MNQRLSGIFACMCFTILACREKPETKPSNFSLNQNIVLFKNDSATGRPLSIAAQQRIVDQINKVKKAGGSDIKILRRCPCDSALVLLEGDDLHNIRIRDEGGTVASNTDPRPGVSGDGSLSAISGSESAIDVPQLLGAGTRNYFTTLPPEARRVVRAFQDVKEYRPITSVAATDKGNFVVGVIDTGLNPAWVGPTGSASRLWRNPAEQTGTPGVDDDNNGFVDDLVGWNFVDINNNPIDRLFHGTLVTELIDEQVRVRPAAAKAVRYMILRTHNDKGQSLLFDDLCAMAYARKNGAKIINVSWGFYDQEGSPLLTYYLRELRDQGVLVVAAAGNIDPLADSAALAGGMDSADLRNLAKHKFWPAGADTISNVLTVTTIAGKPYGPTQTGGSITGPCPRQNWAAPFVDVGVANVGLSCDVINTLIGAGGRAETGSSYAAPVVTGKLAAYLWSNWPQNQDQLMLDQLKAINVVLLPTDPALNRYTRQQQYVQRVDNMPRL